MKTFTLDEIKTAWAVYEKAKVLRVLVNGKWETRPLEVNRQNIPATKAAVKDMSDVMDFPEYLEKEWTK
jgi:hypothetical protein